MNLPAKLSLYIAVLLFSAAMSTAAVGAFESEEEALKVLLDGHMGNNPTITWELGTAKAVVKACEPYDLFLFEEPAK